MALPMGFEPMIFGVKIRYPKPLDEGSMERAAGLEPVILSLEG